jgi:hypothetical protein
MIVSLEIYECLCYCSFTDRKDGLSLLKIVHLFFLALEKLENYVASFLYLPIFMLINTFYLC